MSVRDFHGDSADTKWAGPATNHNEFQWTHDDLEVLRLCVEEVATAENEPNVSIAEATFEASSVPTLSNTCPSTQANDQEISVIQSGGEDILAGWSNYTSPTHLEEIGQSSGFSFNSRQHSNMPLYFGNPTMQQVDIGRQQPQTCNSNSQPFAVSTTEAASIRMDSHRPDQICGSIGNAQNTNSHTYAPGALIPCKYCGNMFLERDLERHLETHLPKELRNPFYCFKCGDKSFARLDTLQKHQTRFHGRLPKSRERR